MAINRIPQLFVVPDQPDAIRILNQGGVRELDFILILSTMALYTVQGGAITLIAAPTSKAANVPAITDSTGGTGAAGGTLAAITVGSTIIDNTGGSSSTTLAAIAAGASYAQADMVAVKNALASFATANNQDNNQLTPVKNALAVLAAEVNAIRSALVNANLMTGP